MMIKIKGIYKHFKGDYYIVEDIAIHTETNEKMVIYRALYGDNILYSRPYELFIGKVDKEKYPILNRTLYHTLNYLKLRLMVENTLYNTDTNKLDTSKNYQLHQIINIYLENNYALKTNLISKKTLLNEFNHFEYDMCLFMPSLDISNNKLNEEKNSIIKVCDEIRTNGI